MYPIPIKPSTTNDKCAEIGNALFLLLPATRQCFTFTLSAANGKCAEIGKARRQWKLLQRSHVESRCLKTRVGQDRIFTPYMTVYLLCNFPAKNTIYTPCIYGSGQPYLKLNHHRIEVEVAERQSARSKKKVPVTYYGNP